MLAWSLNGSYRFRGSQIRYGVVGPKTAPAVVLLHGTPFSSYEWHRIIPWLARRFRVHFHDMLGYGASEKAQGDVSLGVQNTVFAELLDHWGLHGPHVVAHDFGGATALRTHILGGRDYASLTLIDPVALRPWGSPFVAHVREHEAAFAGLPPYAHEALLDAYLRTAMARPMAQGDLAPYKAPWLDEAGRKAFYRQIAQMDMRYTDEVEARYGELRCAVQILWGADDGWIPLETGRRFGAMLPEARFIEVPGAGHLMQEDAPEAIVAALADFPPLAFASGQ
jgi:pimeloyl-ACP methyl ester carboxylesterase